MQAVLLISSLVLVLLSSTGHGYVKRSGETIFIVDTSTTRSFGVAKSHCSSLGGRLACDLTLADKPLLSSIRKDIGKSFWVGGETWHMYGPYYWWTDTMSNIDDSLWCPQEPGCVGGCGVGFGFVNEGNGLFADKKTSQMYALCSFDIRDRNQMQRQKRQSYSLSSDDQTAVLQLLDKSISESVKSQDKL